MPIIFAPKSSVRSVAGPRDATSCAEASSSTGTCVAPRTPSSSAIRTRWRGCSLRQSQRRRQLGIRLPTQPPRAPTRQLPGVSRRARGNPNREVTGARSIPLVARAAAIRSCPAPGLHTAVLGCPRTLHRPSRPQWPSGSCSHRAQAPGSTAEKYSERRSAAMWFEPSATLHSRGAISVGHPGARGPRRSVSLVRRSPAAGSGRGRL